MQKAQAYALAQRLEKEASAHSLTALEQKAKKAENILRSLSTGKVAVTYEDFLYYPTQAYAIYSQELPRSIAQIEKLVGELGQVSGRAKRPESAANRLQRAVSNGWVKEIKSTEQAMDNLWDALGTRIVLKNGDSKSVDIFVENLCSAIKNGDLEVVSVNSLAGKNGLPYLTQFHLEMIEDAASSIGKSIKANPKEYDSGYTVATIFIKYGNNVRGELQLIGQEALNIANAEHWVYDAFLGKLYTEYLEIFSNPEIKELAGKLIERLRKPAEKLTESQKNMYNEYLNTAYINARSLESGISTNTIILPVGLPKELSVESLLETVLK